MLKKKVIRKDVDVLHFMLMATSKLLIGVGIGLLIAVKFWYIQPYWALIILVGGILLFFTLYKLMSSEVKEESKLKRRKLP